MTDCSSPTLAKAELRRRVAEMARTARGIRQAAGLTLADVGVDVGRHESTIARWERGQTGHPSEDAAAERWLALMGQLEQLVAAS